VKVIRPKFLVDMRDEARKRLELEGQPLPQPIVGAGHV
jgi:hypothetical protein